MLREWARAMVSDFVVYSLYNLIVLITVRWNHSGKQSPAYTDIWCNESQVFCCSSSSFRLYIHSGSHTFIGRINIDIFLSNPFQLRFYCSDTILSSIIAYYSASFSRSDRCTFTSYEHALKASSIPQVCRNPPWNSERAIVWASSWRNGVCPWHSTSCWW